MAGVYLLLEVLLTAPAVQRIAFKLVSLHELLALLVYDLVLGGRTIVVSHTAIPLIVLLGDVLLECLRVVRWRDLLLLMLVNVTVAGHLIRIKLVDADIDQLLVFCLVLLTVQCITR